MLTIDALQCSRFDREIFEQLRAGDVTCVTCTVAFWEDAGETMDRIGLWRDLERENHDLILIAASAADIERAHDEGRTAFLLGCQNTTPLEERLRFVELFHAMGIRVMQLTYNNQNAFGSSCYEPNDGGLSRFGRELVEEMNRAGMLIDLSHVGPRTSLDVVKASSGPVAVTHANPAALFEHPRNKSTELLRALADKGGVLGLATYRNITGPWLDSADRWAEMAARTVELIGIDHVGIGTDMATKSGDEDLTWMRQGRWTRKRNYGAGSPSSPGSVAEADWLPTAAEFPAMPEALRRQGFDDDEVEAIMGGNWLRVYRQVFGA